MLKRNRIEYVNKLCTKTQKKMMPINFTRNNSVTGKCDLAVELGRANLMHVWFN